VKRIKVSVSVLLLGLWVPLTSHALLERLEWIHHADGHSHSESGGLDGHDAADGFCRIESDECPLPMPDLQSTSYTGSLELTFAGAPGEPLTFAAGLAPPHDELSELIQIWRFVLRAALSPRAPSLLS